RRHPRHPLRVFFLRGMNAQLGSGMGTMLLPFLGGMGRCFSPASSAASSADTLSLSSGSGRTPRGKRLTRISAEFLLAFSTTQGSGLGTLILILASVLDFFVFGVAIAFVLGRGDIRWRPLRIFFLFGMKLEEQRGCKGGNHVSKNC